MTKKVLVILGTTSTGKTDLGLQLASKFQGELVSCDSRQLYKGLDIGTGKLPSELKIENLKLKIEKGNGGWKIGGVRIWMYDVVDPDKQYTVADYVKDASRAIDEIIKRGKLPIIVGGTGLYLKALLEGLSNLEVSVDKKLRGELQKLTKEKLQEKLQQISPDKWNKLNESDRQNSRRLVRAIEIVILSETKDISKTSDMTLLNYTLHSVQGDKNMAQNDILKIGLTTVRKILYQRIDERVVSRIDQGMIDETERLHKQGLSLKRMRELGLEYGVLADYLEGKITGKEELIKILQGKIHGYARRQITWFKKEKNITWFDIEKKNYIDKVENLVIKWYDDPNLCHKKLTFHIKQ